MGLTCVRFSALSNAREIKLDVSMFWVKVVE